MNRFMVKMSFIMLMIAAYSASFGMMTYYKPPRKVIKGFPEMKATRTKAFSQLLENQQNNIKLIEPRPSEDRAIENVVLSRDELVLIGNNYGVAKECRATCRYMNNHINIPDIKNIQYFFDKRRWMIFEHEKMNYFNFCPFYSSCKLQSAQNLLSDTVVSPKIEPNIKAHRITIFGYSTYLVDLKRFKDFENNNINLDNKNRTELLDDIKNCIVDEPDVDPIVYLHAKCTSRLLSIVEQNNKDCRKAFLFVIALNDVPKLKILLNKNKKKINTCGMPYCSSLYRDWIKQAIKNNSTNALECLLQEDPFNRKNYMDIFTLPKNQKKENEIATENLQNDSSYLGQKII